MHWAEATGLRNVRDSLRALQTQRTAQVPYLEPSRLLDRMADADAPLKNWQDFL